MQNLKFLNSKERKEFFKSLEKTYGFSGELEGNLMLSPKEQKVYLFSGAGLLEPGSDKELRIDRAGLYIARHLSNGIQLNVEGSQLIGPRSTKHMLEIDEDHLEPWVKGQDFDLSAAESERIGGESGIYMVKFKDDFMGSAIIKEGKVKNQLSKIRWVKDFNR